MGVFLLALCPLAHQKLGRVAVGVSNQYCLHGFSLSWFESEQRTHSLTWEKEPSLADSLAPCLCSLCPWAWGLAHTLSLQPTLLTDPSACFGSSRAV